MKILLSLLSTAIIGSANILPVSNIIKTKKEVSLQAWEVRKMASLVGGHKITAISEARISKNFFVGTENGEVWVIKRDSTGLTPKFIAKIAPENETNWPIIRISGSEYSIGVLTQKKGESWSVSTQGSAEKSYSLTDDYDANIHSIEAVVRYGDHTFAATDNKKIWKLGLGGPDEWWTTEQLPSKAISLTVGGGRPFVYAALENKEIWQIAWNSGEARKLTTTNSKVTSMSSYDSDDTVFGTEDGGVWELGFYANKKYQLSEAQGKVSSIRYINDRVYVGAENGTLIVLDPKTWKADQLETTSASELTTFGIIENDWKKIYAGTGNGQIWEFNYS